MRKNSSPPALNPADLRRGAVALLILCSYAEHDSRTVGGGAVNVGIVHVGGADRAGHLSAAVDPDECHLTRTL